MITFFFAVIVGLIIAGIKWYQNVGSVSKAVSRLKWPLPIGAQIALLSAVIALTVIFFINREGFFNNIWGQTEKRLVFIGTIIMSVSYLLSLGRKPNPKIPLIFRDVLMIGLVIYIVANMFGWQRLFGHKEDVSVDKNNPRIAETTKDAVQYHYATAILEANQWTKTGIVPLNEENFEIIPHQGIRFKIGQLGEEVDLDATGGFAYCHGNNRYGQYIYLLSSQNTTVEIRRWFSHQLIKIPQ